MVSEAPTSSEIPWGSVPGDPEPVGSGKEHRPGTYNNESWFCRIPFLFIGVFPFSAVPTPSLPSHRQPFWRALGGSSCPRVFFVKCISLFCMCAFSAYVSGISIPAQGFASNHIAVGASGVWLLTALSLMAAILSLCLFSRPGKTNISDICHSPDTDQ